jgi:hypothetical protein
MDRHGRQIRLAKCPVCEEGDYDGSLIQTDDKRVKSMIEEDREATEAAYNTSCDSFQRLLESARALRLRTRV